MMTKTKQQLRAEAVERLKNSMGARLKPDAAVIAIVGERIGLADWSIECDKLIDLLTDDCGPCYSCAKLAELVAENNVLRSQLEGKGAPVDDRRVITSHNELFEALEEREQDSREKLEADMANILHSAYMYAWMHGHENRRGGSFSHIHREFFNLLDRQAAITERELCDECPARYWPKAIAELQAKVDELTAKLAIVGGDKYHTFCGMTFDEIRELKAKVDELQAAYDALVGKCAELCALCGFQMVDANGEVIS